MRHPQGFGLGNAGVIASRTNVEIKAGESTYTELGVETGVAGLARLLSPGWSPFSSALWRRSAWLSAAWVAMLAIGVQTDVIGVHWIAYVLFALAGAAIGGGLPADEEPACVKALAARIGLYRVAAILIGCALLLEIFRVEVASRQHRGDDRLHARRGRVPGGCGERDPAGAQSRAPPCRARR